MELINKQSALEMLEGIKYQYPVANFQSEMNAGIEKAILFLKEEPAIDAVAVIRCKDCVFADEYNHCRYANWWTDANSFCSRGRKRCD